ncbi:hypothetical protein SERLA73DRAFT_176566 [Serpula lacrymans var. lacrymans S7.3]|uniref:EamA domain-containing protein n=2 Tax=Serpula lacrymans var. lacrymans TaxID=341189 RepID=F8PN66_SERL3|nr:uncharacterized protein SERLADRAFT_359958 [Serpula lacrymans var. lacrymans S7.9]EGO03048.1 hypothetical protein SERLA73DRAFT_176566 [Serpula lacrymans var. lacrymans S7.3]EGO28789.1 hypothetical protein SERLADRAFT_359958 [Serpula lacrymans var. lacrymans S7.9]
MVGRQGSSVAVPRLGGKAAVALFAVVLFAFVIETQLTQYVQSTLGFRQPYFIFYIVHSAFLLSFPIHYLYLLSATKYTHRALVSGLSTAISRQLSNKLDVPHTHQPSIFPTLRFVVLAIILTAGYSVPGLLWFAAISLAPVTDVTAIWNANAFFAYLLSVKLLNLKWDVRRLGAVFLATLGVLAVVYGGSTSSTHDSVAEEASVQSPSQQPSSPFIGDMLTLVASFAYGLYQVLYKKFAALPSDPELASDTSFYEYLSDSESSLVEEGDEPVISADDEIAYPPPFGLHPNLLTGTIGLFTLLTLWIPIPLLHYYDIEKFALPANLRTTGVIAGIASSGVVFNSGFMILLGVWGPIVTSVGNLLTIVLILLSDVIFGFAAITPWSLAGAGTIVAAFAVLVYTMYER